MYDIILLVIIYIAGVVVQYSTARKEDFTYNDARKAALWPITLIIWFIRNILWIIHDDVIVVILLILGFNYKKTNMFKRISHVLEGAK